MLCALKANPLNLRLGRLEQAELKHCVEKYQCHSTAMLAFLNFKRCTVYRKRIVEKRFYKNINGLFNLKINL